MYRLPDGYEFDRFVAQVRLMHERGWDVATITEVALDGQPAVRPPHPDEASREAARRLYRRHIPLDGDGYGVGA